MRYLCTQKNHGYRDSQNPLRGLNMQRLVSLQESGERGEYADLQWFYYYMERSDAMIHSVIQRRRAALLSLDWDVRIVSQATDDPLAQEQADFLRMVYDNIDNFREAVSFLFTGFFRGFAHLEKHWTPSGLIERLEPVEQWFWVRDGLFGDWEYNPGAVSGARRGTLIDPENFIILETAALDRILSVLYLRKNLSQSDWDSFLSVYGIPSIFLVGPPNANVNAAHNNGMTCLFAAAAQGHPEIVKLLIEANADVNARPENGITPLIAAVYKGHVGIVKQLIEAGADVNIAPNDDMTPFRVATTRGYEEIARVLTTAGAR